MERDRHLPAGRVDVSVQRAATPHQPASQRTLSVTLRGLERDGLVSRTVHPTEPPQVDCALVERCLSLLEAVRDLARWADVHAKEINACRAEHDARQR
ncbi:winged helix-turn-helix transcriptional regulator [Streptomyces sp. NPDC058086]|uniref:winged helix-turn-helix transcriptional regulator n=1 Tax=Streptomyces sp. NPDC058086 TaxID=3346334 RepID=UPI0036E9ABED